MKEEVTEKIGKYFALKIKTAVKVMLRGKRIASNANFGKRIKSLK